MTTPSNAEQERNRIAAVEGGTATSVLRLSEALKWPGVARAYLATEGYSLEGDLDDAEYEELLDTVLEIGTGVMATLVQRSSRTQAAEDYRRAGYAAVDE